MTAKGNLGTCRYAYPQCPTDPEQLVHYLNNHNGGFFRFFNAPQLSSPQQNLQQFYNQLSVPQNYGLYQPQYGLQQSFSQQNYGSYQGQPPQNYGLYPNAPGTHGYGFPNPNLYGNNIGTQNYGPNYPYQNNYGLKFKSNDENKKDSIQKRIQTKPVTYTEEQGYKDDLPDNDDHNSKWLFPENVDNIKYVRSEQNHYLRDSKGLKFPEKEIQQTNIVAQDDFNRKGKGFAFPNKQNNVKYVNYVNHYTIPDYMYTNNFDNNYNRYYNANFNNNNNYNENYATMSAINKKYYQNNFVYHNQYDQNTHNDDGLETVYIVRGNGDPNNPEIVKVKPGEIIQ